MTKLFDSLQANSQHISAGELSGLRFLSLVYFAIFVGETVWRSTIHTYAVGTFGAGGREIGLLFSVAAMPGLLAVGIGWIAKFARSWQLLIASCSAVGCGLIWIGQAPSWHTVLPGVLVTSCGFVMFYAVVNSLCLLGSTNESAPVALGRLKSFGPLASMGAGLLVFLAFERLGARTFLTLAGTGVCLCSIVAAANIRKRPYAITHGELRITIELWPYYALNFLAGCRSAVFKAFVLLLLIKEYKLQIHGTAALVIAGHFAGLAGYRTIGWLATRLEPATILSGLYTLVVINFAGFALLASNDFVSMANTLALLKILFVVDSFLFGASVITDSYLKRRSAPAHLIGNIASGQSLFYLAGLLAPFVGGLMWDTFGMEATFLLGCCFAGAAVVVSRFLGHSHGGQAHS